MFESLPEGAYLVRASRANFMPAEYGQKRWNSAGVPVSLKEEDRIFLSIRLFRYSAINGTVVDENEEGLPEHEVLAYRDSKPPELMAHATSDDRGVYRLHGLPPGTYIVRTAGEQSNGESYLPTYSKETGKLDEARMVELLPEQDADDVDVRPLTGRLYGLSVDVERLPPGADSSITLVSDTGRRTVVATKYKFTRLPPGEYDVFAQSPSDPAPGDKVLGAYQHVLLGADAGVTLLLRGPSGVSVAGAPDGADAEIRIRQGDLAGGDTSSVLPVHHGSATLPIGRWEVLLDPPSGYYVSSVAGNTANRGRPDGWQELTSPGYSGLRFTVSAGASSIHGVVRDSNDPVPGAPVYLEAYNLTENKREADLRTAITDTHGQYRFDDLAPGTYRILATFEYLSPDSNTLSAAGALPVTLDAHTGISRDLDLYTIQ